jgi:mannan endo-1,4-beta-mannosidase
MMAAVLAVLPATSAAATSRAVASTPPLTGFVARAGTQLELNGQPWNFAGYNLPCQQPFTMTTAQLEYYFEDLTLNSKANVVRMWWFQSDLGTGVNKWAPFERIVKAANATGVRIVATLTNQWQACDEPTPSTPEKIQSWYQSGYKHPEGGYALSYKQFARQIAAHFANQPTIALWQLVNEAEAPTASGCLEHQAATALRGFADDMAATLHQVDPHHLINLGTQGAGECGIAAGDYGYVHAGNIDVCEVHDYTNPALALPAGSNSLSSDIRACHALDKPIFIGEAGIPANVQPDGSSGPAPVTSTTLTQRAQFFKAKIDAFDGAGGVGYLIWFKSPFYTIAESNLDIPDGDPTESVLVDALAIPPAPRVTTSELAWPAGVLGVATLTGGGVLIAWRRRPEVHA